ncbi:hypothetical protein [Paracoccus marinaquae]|uniref:Uncharacterized protein n=1 Tax=Paracoccus marinaquae TaxID=2841926 RepID=A0ABS6ALH0_9RHOB|nr:hypothetical protein [Paracoccus marinaquae]MBU3030490.1 hypothetical protein [Paracoccus marinaquae]
MFCCYGYQPGLAAHLGNDLTAQAGRTPNDDRRDRNCAVISITLAGLYLGLFLMVR